MCCSSHGFVKKQIPRVSLSILFRSPWRDSGGSENVTSWYDDQIPFAGAQFCLFFNETNYRPWDCLGNGAKASISITIMILFLIGAFCLGSVYWRKRAGRYSVRRLLVLKQTVKSEQLCHFGDFFKECVNALSHLKWRISWNRTNHYIFSQPKV